MRKKKKSKQHTAAHHGSDGWKTGGMALQMQTFEDVADIALAKEFAVSNPRSGSLRKLEQTHSHAPFSDTLTETSTLDRGGDGRGSFATMLTSLSEQKLDLEGQTVDNPMSGLPPSATNPLHQAGGSGTRVLEETDKVHDLPFPLPTLSSLSPHSFGNCRPHTKPNSPGLHRPPAVQPAKKDPRELSAPELVSWFKSVNIPENVVNLLEPHEFDGKC